MATRLRNKNYSKMCLINSITWLKLFGAFLNWLNHVKHKNSSHHGCSNQSNSYFAIHFIFILWQNGERCVCYENNLKYAFRSNDMGTLFRVFDFGMLFKKIIVWYLKCVIATLSAFGRNDITLLLNSRSNLSSPIRSFLNSVKLFVYRYVYSLNKMLPRGS